MELNMRYTTAADGIRIAFATVGKGLPLIRAPFAPFSHCQLEWRQGAFFERLSRHRMVIPFDPRGTGLSDQSVEDYSLDARMLDIDAIANALGLDRFALHGIGSSGALVISYAVQHPERVSHVILDDAFVDGHAYLSRPHIRAVGLLAQDWEAMTENIAFMSQGYGGEDARRYADYLRACSTPEAAFRQWSAIAEVDVTDLLPRVKAPTLVMQHQGVRSLRPDDGREIAKRIPDARLVVLDGHQGDIDNVLFAIAAFLGDEGTAPVPSDHPGAFRTEPETARESLSPGTVTVLFTDIADSTALTERMGDARFRAASRGLDEGLRAAIREAGGALVEGKVLGDGVMATFASATRAIEAARRCVALSAKSELRLHVGLHAGDVIREGDNVYGGAVNIASRICGLCDPGEILVSATVRDLARTSAGVTFEDRGDQILKGIADPVRVFAVRPGQ